MRKHQLRVPVCKHSRPAECSRPWAPREPLPGAVGGLEGFGCDPFGAGSAAMGSAEPASQCNPTAPEEILFSSIILGFALE